MKKLILLAIGTVGATLVLDSPAQDGNAKWRHLSSVNGDLPVPNSGKEQTASLVCDIDKDGINDFAIAERTQAPALVWYRRSASGWTRYVVEAGPLPSKPGPMRSISTATAISTSSSRATSRTTGSGGGRILILISTRRSPGRDTRSRSSAETSTTT